MALIKKHTSRTVDGPPEFESIEEVLAYCEQQSDTEMIGYALEKLSGFEGGGRFLVEKLIQHSTDKDLAARIASMLANIERKSAPIESVMELLKLKNAYIRNLGIEILRDYGDAIKYYIVKFLIGDDRDLRIFAINVLGDVDFAESREMLIELLENEQDINVAMTAVDYMGEIGEKENIALLESLKERFDNDPYVLFAVDGAIRLIKG